MEEVKILIVNTNDKGGAANSCLRLRHGLLDIGINVKLLLQHKTKNLTSVEVAKPLLPIVSRTEKAKKILRKILKEFNLYRSKTKKEKPFLWKRSSNLEMFSYPSSNYDITDSVFYKEADIINLHWVANFLDFESFFKKNEKPVVWTLHDMNPFTGGEHYTENFVGIDEEGFPIKRILNDFEIAEFKKNIWGKKASLSVDRNLTIVAPSQWLAQEARKSEVFKNFPVHCIPYGLDAEIFAPRDKHFSKDILGLPREKKVVLFVADATGIPRKGFEYLKKAFEQLNLKDVILCAVGQKYGDLDSRINIIELGPVHDERMMSMAYSAADVFVIPSLMDNLPNTVLESIMCGTPVIGFPVGGISEMIIDGKNGLLTKEISVNSLVETLIDFLDKPERFDKDEIRADALKKYDKKIQAERYISLFKEINGQV